VIVGYTPYVESIRDLICAQQTVTSGMRRELERCREAVHLAAAGNRVALVSSGDAGIYGMAGLAMEVAAAEDLKVVIEVVPGVTAASAAASQLGAPLMLDFAAISLSDLLVPWPAIEKRLEALARADIVVCLYNPRSCTREEPLRRTLEIFRKYRPSHTIVGMARDAGKATAETVLTTLDSIDETTVDMRTTVIIGNSDGKIIEGHWVTARGYRV
jgi:precorrin-3B C17-methyltransferase